MLHDTRLGLGPGSTFFLLDCVVIRRYSQRHLSGGSFRNLCPKSMHFRSVAMTGTVLSIQWRIHRENPAMVPPSILAIDFGSLKRRNIREILGKILESKGVRIRSSWAHIAQASNFPCWAYVVAQVLQPERGLAAMHTTSMNAGWYSPISEEPDSLIEYLTYAGPDDSNLTLDLLFSGSICYGLTVQV